MTNEVAKKTLNAILMSSKSKSDKEALDLAIKALEQQPSEDCISRKEVLEYLDKMPSELTSDGRRMVRCRMLEEYISDTLPSVTPQPKILEEIREEIVSHIGGNGAVNDGIDIALEVIDKYMEEEE